MPQEPKKRHSRQRQGKRRAAISLGVPSISHRLKNFYKALEQDKKTVAHENA
ncbi:MAG: hypothetical protein QG600_248 [Patescibacteria group bacterium]|jgi:ribosomal protein L32|nr:hypothetical protein [Patescibacteria group bacterium]